MTESHAGLLVIDKPAGMTSRAAVDRALRWLPKGTRIGHTGTLDPLATGVLVLCIGVATRLAEYVQAMRKTYRAGLILGAKSNTDDADGILTPVEDAHLPDEQTVRQAVQGFEGDQVQVPPAFSAAKVTGRRAYKLARRGMNPDLQPRTVTIYRITLLDYRYPNLDLEIECSKGTYIRSLARDLGERLGCGAYIGSLRRTRVGRFDVADAIPLDASSVVLRPMEEAVSELPRCIVSSETVPQLRQGRMLDAGAVSIEKAPTPDTEYAAFDEFKNLIGVIAWKDETWRPVKVLHRS